MSKPAPKTSNDRKKAANKPVAVKDLPAKPASTHEAAVKGGGGRATRVHEDAG